MNKKYYHICSYESSDSILENGLKCDDEGAIFILDNAEVAETVNFNQLMHDKYTLIEIDSKGINSDIQNDNVAEFTAKSQFYIEQNIIKPEFLKKYLDKEVNMFDIAIKQNIELNSKIDDKFAKKTIKEKLINLYESFNDRNPKFGTYIKEQINKLE